MAYDVLDITTAVQDDLKDPSFSASRILRYINQAQRKVFNTFRFKFTETTVCGSLTINEYTFEQQDDHQKTIGGTIIDPTNTSRRVHLNEKNFLDNRTFFSIYPDPSYETASMPSLWTEYGDQVYFNCKVDKAYTFRQRYYKTPIVLTATSDVPETPEVHRELVELWCMYRAEKYRGNHDIAATHKQDFEDELESAALRYASRTDVAPTVLRSGRARI